MDFKADGIVVIALLDEARGGEESRVIERLAIDAQLQFLTPGPVVTGGGNQVGAIGSVQSPGCATIGGYERIVCRLPAIDLVVALIAIGDEQAGVPLGVGEHVDVLAIESVGSQKPVVVVEVVLHDIAGLGR